MSTVSSSPAQAFTDMANRLDKNPGEFAGGYVIISPAGKVISQAFINPEGDESAFWGFVAAQVQVAQTEALQKEEAKMGMFPGRR